MFKEEEYVQLDAIWSRSETLYWDEAGCFADESIPREITAKLQSRTIYTYTGRPIYKTTVSGVVMVERLERSLQFLFSRVERRSSS